MSASKNASDKHKILLVDGHAIFRDGLRRILNDEKNLDVCGDAADAVDGLKQAARLKPALAIVDVSLEGTNGIDLCKTLRAQFPRLRILVLSTHKETLYAERALRAGANGYIMKRENAAALLAAIRQVLNGQTYISKELNETILNRLSDRGHNVGSSPVERLSDRELDVFQYIGQGYGTRQISEALHISMKTVEFHRENIRAKLKINSTFELVQHAIHWVFHEKGAGT